MHSTDGDLACSISGSAATDLPSNAVLLSQLPPAALASLTGHRLERRVLPDVVHELTHHWCFASPVGDALTVLRLETLVRVVSSGAEVSGSELARMFDPLARYEHAAFGLRPVAEALALFAEFEATPGASPVTALPLWLAAYLSDRAMAADLDVEDMAGAVTASMRSSPELARHRELLVGKDWTSPYATGYTALLGWWERLRAHSAAAADPEVFLSFMRRWFYEDLELVDVLLGEFQPGTDPRPALDEHLDWRFNLLSFLPEAAASGIDAYVAGGWQASNEAVELHSGDVVVESFRQHFDPGPSSIDRDRWQRGHERLDARKQNLFEVAAGLPGGFQQLVLGLLSGRPLATLADQPVPVADGPDGAPEPVLTEPLASALPASGRITVLLCPYIPDTLGMLLVTRDGERRGVVVHGNLPPGIVDQARAGIYDPHRLREIMRGLNDILEEKILRKMPRALAWLEDRDVAWRSGSDRAFQHAAAAIAATPQAQQALLTGGLHRVLGPAAHQLLIEVACKSLEPAGPGPGLLAKVEAAGQSAGVSLSGPYGLRV